MYFYLLLNKDFIIIILLFTSSRKRDRAKMARKCRRKPNVKLLVLLICRARCSLFQALRQWGRRKRKRHANSWRGEKEEKDGRETPPSLSPCQFPPVLFSCLHFLNSADPTISEPGTGYARCRHCCCGLSSLMS